MDRTQRHIDNIIGDNIRAARVSQGMLVKELARKIGIDEQMLLQIEAGQNRASASEIWSVSQILGCTPSTLFKNEDNFIEEPSPTLAECHRILCELSPAQLQNALAYIKSLSVDGS